MLGLCREIRFYESCVVLLYASVGHMKMEGKCAFRARLESRHVECL